MTEKYLMIDLEEEKAGKIAEILASKTCKKILSFLSENEASESEIALSLKVPVNTIEYNLKKLIDAGLVEKKNFFWSRKGKKVLVYKTAKKTILISQKSKMVKSVIPVAIISAILSYLIWFITNIGRYAEEKLTESASMMTGGNPAAETAVSGNYILTYLSAIPTYIWFLLGAMIALLIFMIINWRKL